MQKGSVISILKERSLVCLASENSTQCPITAHESFKATWCHHARRTVTLSPMNHMTTVVLTGFFKQLYKQFKSGLSFVVTSPYFQTLHILSPDLMIKAALMNTVPRSSPAEESPRVQLLRDINKENYRNNSSLIRHSKDRAVIMISS